MDIQTLKYFLAVAECESISKAAKELYISQPTLSQHIIQLEKELGVLLFQNGKRKMILSKEGALFESRARELINLANKTVAELNESMEDVSGRITIYCDEFITVKRLSSLLMTFSHEYPHASYKIYTASSTRIRERLDDGIADIGVMTDYCNDSRYESVVTSDSNNWSVIMKNTDPLAEKEFVTPADFDSKPLILLGNGILSDRVISWLGDYYDEANVRVNTNIKTIMPSLVQNGLGYGFMPESYSLLLSNRRTTCRPLKPMMNETTALYWRKDIVPSKTLALFIEHVQKYYHH